MIFLLRVAPVQKRHGSVSVMLLQIEHSRTFSLASRIASESANACSAVHAQQMKGEALRGLLADAGQVLQFVDQIV